MPRIARKDMITSFFHIITQGIDKEYIFEKQLDKVEYEKCILLYKEEFHIQLLTYCIMDNHTHIVVHVEENENMAEFMHKVNTQYAIYYNKKYNRTGYVFKNRYKSQMITSLKHLYRCIDYIHDNPVKAGICTDRGQYEFSGFVKLYQSDQKQVRKTLKNQLDCYLMKTNDKNADNVEFDNSNMEFIEDIKIDKKLICKEEIEKYIEKEHINKENLLKDKEKLKKIVSILKAKNISYRVMEENLRIGRETLRKLQIQ